MASLAMPARPVSPTAQPPRMAPLAKLPLFFELGGRRAIVAGGSAAAAWKVELLAACGAQVLVVAEQVSGEMAEAIRTSDLIALERRRWSVADLSGVALALLAAEDEIEAAAFARAARAAGTPVNVIDMPAFCDFQFGAIVNRSPVVVGISTDGAAPILGQAIRRRIEAMLPSGLATWAASARRIRDRVATELRGPQLRRAFWEKFADLALGTEPTRSTDRQLENLMGACRSPRPSGRVTLVGAGPGDAELLTLKAVRALQSADVVLYDDLVLPEVLDLARREARRIAVGKRGGRPSCRQNDINHMMIDSARDGLHVVRLKGGDPMIFGRAGEEIAELSAAGIPYDVVPGITAALALAARLGVSLTHREMAHSVRFVTGHGRDGELPPNLDWRGLADPETTLIIYMGGRTAAAAARRLCCEGLAPDTPACAVESLSRPDEARWHGTLGELQASASGHPSDGPMLIGIGRSFAGLSACARSHAMADASLSVSACWVWDVRRAGRREHGSQDGFRRSRTDTP